jgi:hypothetical protein
MADGGKKAGTYTQALADSIEKQREAALKLAQVKPQTEQQVVSQFKSSVIGAEGTGPNRLGSSAAGFGQFMPSTFLSYFNRLFPDRGRARRFCQARVPQRPGRREAVIDKATDDYVAVLKHAGQAITAANLYTVHLLGQRDATRLLKCARRSVDQRLPQRGRAPRQPVPARHCGERTSSDRAIALAIARAPFQAPRWPFSGN